MRRRPTLVNSLPISELNNSTAARAVSFENQLNSQHEQRVAHYVEVAVHVRVDGLLGCSGNPQSNPSVG